MKTKQRRLEQAKALALVDSIQKWLERELSHSTGVQCRHCGCVLVNYRQDSKTGRLIRQTHKHARDCITVQVARLKVLLERRFGLQDSTASLEDVLEDLRVVEVVEDE